MAVDPASKRLQLLEPFDAWNGKDLEVLPYPARAPRAAHGPSGPAQVTCSGRVGHATA